MPYAVAAIGIGLSAASAFGAFGGKVDKWAPTPQEMEAAKWAKNVYNLGRDIQVPLDELARKDLTYLGSDAAANQAQGLAVSDAAGGLYPQLDQNALVAAQASGGPGSGRWWDTVKDSKAGLNRGLTTASVQGRLGALNNYMTRTGQFLDRRTADLKSGLAGMTSGGQQAADAQAARIQGQVANKIAANQSMGQIGGMLTSVGMAGGGMTWGGGGVPTTPPAKGGK